MKEEIQAITASRPRQKPRPYLPPRRCPMRFSEADKALEDDTDSSDWMGTGAVIEKGKPKKRHFQFGATQPTAAEQKLTEQQMLDAIKKAMKPKQ